MIANRPLSVAAFAALLLAMAACQSSSPPSAHAMAAPQQAVVISGGNGGSATVFIRSDDPKNPTVLCDANTLVCPYCKAAAIKYFETGVLEPTCAHSGATRTVVAVPAISNGAHG